MAMYRCACGEWVSSTEKHKCKPQPFNVIMTDEEKQKNIFEECKWCNGSGDDGGGYNACPDCESTGLKGGRYALEKMDEDIEKQYKETLK
jgi:hypothetical protein